MAFAATAAKKNDAGRAADVTSSETELQPA
jgi:hypothetical protein